MEAKYYTVTNDCIKCHLCPHECTVREGEVGICRVRKNVGGKFEALSYGVISSIALDPIEKKPLYHFYPAASILSVGSVGCNFRCQFCQNYSISQLGKIDFLRYERDVTPSFIFKRAKEAKQYGSIGVAYTYNEPAVNIEFVLDVAAKVKEAGMVNVMVTNGYIQQKPLGELLEVIDAFNVDLKGYSDEFYRHMLGGRKLPVMRTLQQISSLGRHLEVSYLVIPGENDDRKQFREVCEWIRDNLDGSTVLHVNRYFPNYHLDYPPTSLTTMIDLFVIAKEILPHVYMGNTGLAEYNNSYCTRCGKLLIARRGMSTEIVGLSKDGCCSACGARAW